MERLHRLCRNASMRKSATAVSLQPAGSGNQETSSKGFNHQVSTVYWNPYRRGKSMNRKLVRTITSGTFALVAVLCGARPGRAADAKYPYPTSMAPLDQYLMDRNDEIALARSAAPPSIAKDATVLVLGRQGFETAVEGTNGFVCNVDRWMDQFENSPEFWNPKRHGPVCYNPQAAKTLIPILMIRTKLALAGKSK